MKKVILACILTASVISLAGCGGNPESSENSSASSSSSVSESSQNPSDESSANSESSASSENSAEESSIEASSSSAESPESNAPIEIGSGIHVSTCSVPAWGITDKTQGEACTFMIGCEYETYRVLKIAEFEGGALKEIKVRVYVISEAFDMNSFKEKWGFEPVWNGSYYEGTAQIPAEYAGKSVDEIKLAIAEPILEKYGAETIDGFSEVVMVDPSIAPDPAIEF